MQNRQPSFANSLTGIDISPGFGPGRSAGQAPSFKDPRTLEGTMQLVDATRTLSPRDRETVRSYLHGVVGSVGSVPPEVFQRVLNGLTQRPTELVNNLRAANRGGSSPSARPAAKKDPSTLAGAMALVDRQRLTGQERQTVKSYLSQMSLGGPVPGGDLKKVLAALKRNPDAAIEGMRQANQIAYSGGPRDAMDEALRPWKTGSRPLVDWQRARERESDLTDSVMQPRAGNQTLRRIPIPADLGRSGATGSRNGFSSGYDPGESIEQRSAGTWEHLMRRFDREFGETPGYWENRNTLKYRIKRLMNTPEYAAPVRRGKDSVDAMIGALQREYKGLHDEEFIGNLGEHAWDMSPEVVRRGAGYAALTSPLSWLPARPGSKDQVEAAGKRLYGAGVRPVQTFAGTANLLHEIPTELVGLFTGDTEAEKLPEYAASLYIPNNPASAPDDFEFGGRTFDWIKFLFDRSKGKPYKVGWPDKSLVSERKPSKTIPRYATEPAYPGQKSLDYLYQGHPYHAQRAKQLEREQRERDQQARERQGRKGR
jgi:hypothetical protein